MKLKKIYKILDRLSAFELQESWDNSGLQVGSMQSRVKQIVLSIDIDRELLERLEPDTLLITHHPLIFSGLKQIDTKRYPAALLELMIQKNISNIAMHTNFDKTHLNAYVTQTVLGYEIIKEEPFVCYFRVDERFDTFASKIAQKLSLKSLKTVRGKKKIKTAAITTGSGGSLIPKIKADCFLTGDIKYHDAMEAKALNLALIEIGHYESEHFFAEVLAKHLINLDLGVIISSSKNPFTYL